VTESEQLREQHELELPTSAEGATLAAQTTIWGDVDRTRRFSVPHRWRNPLGLVGAAIIGFTVLVAIFGPFIWTLDPNAPIYKALSPPTWSHPMGTDELGRDTMARIIHGAQVSLEVGIFSVAIAVLLGGTLGILSGYAGGAVDATLMRLVDIMFALPGLILAFVVVGLLGPSQTNATIAIGLSIAPAFARVLRGAVLETIALPFIEAAHALGAGHTRMVRKHVLPNIIAPMIVLVTIYLAVAILSEAALSFLGLGTQLPEASWGNMLNEARGYVYQSVWMSIFPGAAIMLVVLGFNLLGDGLRDVLDPRLVRRTGAS
jgi:ABC-type dipeptide/oligopeptide/nickel transport system permease subunit